MNAKALTAVQKFLNLAVRMGSYVNTDTNCPQSLYDELRELRYQAAGDELLEFIITAINFVDSPDDLDEEQRLLSYAFGCFEEAQEVAA